MSKYIIEIDDDLSFDVQFLQAIGAEPNGVVRIRHIEFEKLEELNSDYINEHFGDPQDDAYQRGLNEAWECARKLFSSMADSDIEKAFPIEWNNGGFHALINLQPQEAIAKLKAYEKKQSDKIKVGDEVRWCRDLIVITRLYMDGGFKWCDGISKDGRAFHVLEESVSKTNRHFDIESILEDMRE